MPINPRSICLTLLMAVLLAACETTQGSAPIARPQIPLANNQQGSVPAPQIPVNTPKIQAVNKLSLPHMQGRNIVRIALLLPFSSKNESLRDQARSMLDAAQMAVIESGDLRLLLIPKDTGGTQSGANSAARLAIASGADILVGPLLSRAVSGAAIEARQAGVPIIAFSTDRSVAGNGVYLMNFLPENEVARIIDYAASQGHSNFALLRNKTRYGERVETAMQYQTLANGGILTDIAIYPGQDGQKNAPIAELAHTTKREELLEIWREAGGIGDPALDPEFEFELPYTAILIAESGLRLQSLVPLLPYFDVDPRKTRFLGTGQWFDEKLNREPALNGGWFAGPAKPNMDIFRASFTKFFAEQPKRLAPLVYDAVRVAATITEIMEDGSIIANLDKLENRQGFSGATGLFRFSTNGLAEHSLAVYQMRQGRFEVIDPAPVQFEPEPFLEQPS